MSAFIEEYRHALFLQMPIKSKFIEVRWSTDICFTNVIYHSSQNIV